MSGIKLEIETTRLLLRRFTLNDIDAAYQMNLDTEVSKYTGDGGVVSRAEIQKRITEDVLGDYHKYGYGRLAVELKATQKFIGFAGLKYLDDLNEVDLGYRFMTPYWGKGYATEAGKACVHFGFKNLGLKKIVGFVLPENLGSIRVLEKLGFLFDKEVEEDGMLIQRFQITKP